MAVALYVFSGVGYFRVTPFSFGDCENICSSSYWHHQIGTSNHHPFPGVLSQIWSPLIDMQQQYLTMYSTDNWHQVILFSSVYFSLDVCLRRRYHHNHHTLVAYSEGYRVSCVLFPLFLHSV